MEPTLFENPNIENAEIIKCNEELNLLTKYGNIGFYSHCKVTQIVILEQNSGKAYNYFTNIHFSQNYNCTSPFEYILKQPLTKKTKYQLAISTYIIPINQCIKLLSYALSHDIWNYKDQYKRDAVILDTIFPTDKKYIPEIDPTGSLYNLMVPIEQSLYGSNYSGNYYLYELYSRKDYLNTILDKNDIQQIQTIITNNHLIYNLEQLNDRIGNVVCKFDVEVLIATPLKLRENHGISFKFSSAEELSTPSNLIIQSYQQHDGMMYNYNTEQIQLSKKSSYVLNIEPNQCKNTIIISDISTNLIVFLYNADYSVYSNYNAQITPPTKLSQAEHDTRTIHLDNNTIQIPLSGISMLGNVYLDVEMMEAGKRQQQWSDIFFSSQHYFLTYTKNQHEKALNDLRSIINSDLLWDLDEIWIIDPYLSPQDILKTVVYCKKKDITIKCLTNIGSISYNKKNKFQTKQNYKTQLDNAIPTSTDINLEYRTVFSNHGMKFHDRYIILKYQLNKTRAWSLGTSINSLGKSHHTMQILEAPELISNIFEKVWNETNNDDCIIYKSKS